MRSSRPQLGLEHKPALLGSEGQLLCEGPALAAAVVDRTTARWRCCHWLRLLCGVAVFG